MNQWVWTAAQSWNYRPWLWMHSCGEAGTQSQGCETVNYRAYKIIHMWNRQVRWFPIMNPPKPKWIVHENHKHLLRKSPCQAGAWRSFWERQAPAWPLDGMFFIGYYLTVHGLDFGILAEMTWFWVIMRRDFEQVDNCWFSSQIICCWHPNRRITLRLSKRIIKILHLLILGCQCPFYEKTPRMKNTDTPYIRKVEMLDQMRGKLRLNHYSIRTEQEVFWCD